MTQKSLSKRLSIGRGWRRFSMVSCCRSARFSRTRCRRLRNARASALDQRKSRFNMARSYTRIADGYCSKLLILRPVRVLANNTARIWASRREHRTAESALPPRVASCLKSDSAGCTTGTIGLPDPDYLSPILNLYTPHAHAPSRPREPSRSRKQLLAECRLPVHVLARKHRAIFGADRILARQRGYKPAGYAAATTRMRPWRRERGAVFTTISTSRPSSVKKCMSLPVEKPETWPRRSRDIFGWSIFKMPAALA